MQVHKTRVSDTRIRLTLEADQGLLEDTKHEVLLRLKRDVKIPGFRAGKVPLDLVEKNISAQTLQSEFLDAALNKMYGHALGEQNVRPVSQPSVSIKKFVPFTTLEFEAELDIIGEVELPDYTKITLTVGTWYGPISGAVAAGEIYPDFIFIFRCSVDFCFFSNP